MFIGYLLCANHFNEIFYTLSHLMSSSNAVLQLSQLFSVPENMPAFLPQNFCMCCTQSPFPPIVSITCTHPFFFIGILFWTVRCSCQQLSQHAEIGPLRHLTHYGVIIYLSVYSIGLQASWKQSVFPASITVPNTQQILSKYFLSPQVLKII